MTGEPPAQRLMFATICSDGDGLTDRSTRLDPRVAVLGRAGPARAADQRFPRLYSTPAAFSGSSWLSHYSAGVYARLARASGEASAAGTTKHSRDGAEGLCFGAGSLVGAAFLDGANVGTRGLAGEDEEGGRITLAVTGGLLVGLTRGKGPGAGRQW